MTKDAERVYRQEKIYKVLHSRALSTAPFALRITRRKNIPPPLLVVKERRAYKSGEEGVCTSHLCDCGDLHGDSLRRLLPVVRKIVSCVKNENDVPLEIGIFLSGEVMHTQRTLVLDEEAGAKLGIIFKLQKHLTGLDRAELLSRRVAIFSREEALYWFSRISHYGPTASQWAISGLRIILCGHNNGKESDVASMLEKLRSRQ